MSVFDICYNNVYNIKRQQMLYNTAPYRYTPLSPYPNYTQDQLNMKRKEEILKYGSNSQNYNRSGMFSQLTRNPSNNLSMTLTQTNSNNLPLYNYINNTNAYGTSEVVNTRLWSIFSTKDDIFPNNIANGLFRIQILNNIDKPSYEIKYQTPFAINISGVCNDISGTNYIIEYNIENVGVDIKYNDNSTGISANVSYDLSGGIFIFSQTYNYYRYLGLLTVTIPNLYTVAGYVYDIYLNFNVKLTPNDINYFNQYSTNVNIYCNLSQFDLFPSLNVTYYTFKTFTSSTKTVINGKTDVYYVIVGGGGSGYIESSTNYAGGGGGGGGIISGIIKQDVTTVYNIDVGSGGSADKNGISSSISNYNYLKWATSSRGIFLPQGIFIHNGYLYVSNSNNIISKISITNPTTDYNSIWATYYQGLDEPSGLVVNNGYLYVSNSGNNTIGKISLTSPSTDYNPTWGIDVTAFANTYGLLFNGAVLYVFNSQNNENNTISKINLGSNDYNYNWATIQGLNNSYGSLIYNGYLYVTDSVNNKISKISVTDPVNDFNTNWITQGLDQPYGIVYYQSSDNVNHFYVSNSGNNTITNIYPDSAYVENSTWVGSLRSFTNPYGLFRFGGNTLYIFNSLSNENNTVSQIQLIISYFNYNWLTLEGLNNTCGSTKYEWDLYVCDYIDNKIGRINVQYPDSQNDTNFATSADGLNNPYGIAVYIPDPNDIGNREDKYLYVSNSGNDTISKIPVLDNPNPGESTWATSTEGLDNPKGLDISNGYVYVLNSGNDTISKISLPDPNTNTTIGWATSTQGLDNPRGIRYYDNYLYVSNSGNDTISKISLPDPTTNTTTSWATSTQGLSNPTFLEISNDYLYVLNSGNNTISKISIIDPTDNPVLDWPTDDPQYIDPNLNEPKGMSVYKDPLSDTGNGYAYDYLYVSNSGNDTISKINILFTKTVNEDINLPDPKPQTVPNWATSAQGLDIPYGIKYYNDYLYVTNSGDHTISKISVANPTTEFSANWATSTQGLSSPIGLDLYNNYLYVLNSGNNRISKISVTNPDTSYNDIWGTYYRDINNPNINNPKGLDISNGYLYVSNLGNSTISKISLTDPVNDNSANWATSTQGLNAPYGIRYYNNYLYVTNSGDHTISKISVANPNTDFSANWAKSVQGLNTPTGLDVYNGYLHVANSNSSTISKINIIDPSGDYDPLFGITNQGISSPNGLIFYNNNMYVANSGNNYYSITEFGSIYKLNLYIISSGGFAGGEPTNITGGTGGASGGTSLGLSNVPSFTENGTSTSGGNGGGVLFNGTSIGNISGYKINVVLNSSNTFTGYYGGGGAGGDSRELFLDSSGNFINNGTYGGSCNTSKLLATSIQGLYIPKDMILINNYFYVSNSGDNTISKIDINGTTVDTSWYEGLYNPRGLVDYDGYLYVSNLGNNTIVKIYIDDPNDNTVYATSTQGLNEPYGLDVYDDYLYVSNTGNNTISKISLPDPTTDTTVDWATSEQGLNYPIGLVYYSSFFYVLNQNGGGDGDGSISKISLTNPTTIYTANWATSTHGLYYPTSLICDTNNNFLYVTNSQLIPTTISKIGIGLNYPTSVNSSWYILPNSFSVSRIIADTITYPADMYISVENGGTDNSGSIILLSSNSIAPGKSNTGGGAIGGDDNRTYTFSTSLIEPWYQQSPYGFTDFAIDDASQNLYFSTYSYNKIVKINLNNIADVSLNWASYEVQGIANTFGLAIDKDNSYLYVSNYTEFSYLSKIGLIHPDTSFNTPWLGIDTDPLYLSGLQGLAIDNGYIYIANNNNYNVSKVSLPDPNNDYDRYFVGSGEYPLPDRPGRLIAYNGYLYVGCGSFITRVRLNDKTDYIQIWAGPAQGINNVFGLACYGNYIYVSNGFLGTICKISLSNPTTEFNASWQKGIPGLGPIIANNDGILYIAGSDNAATPIIYKTNIEDSTNSYSGGSGIVLLFSTSLFVNGITYTNYKIGSNTVDTNTDTFFSTFNNTLYNNFNTTATSNSQTYYYLDENNTFWANLVFYGSGTVTITNIPAGKTAYILAVGGGGGGGSVTNPDVGAGGGGAGGFIQSQIYPVAGDVFTITVGSGGIGGLPLNNNPPEVIPPTSGGNTTVISSVSNINIVAYGGGAGGGDYNNGFFTGGGSSGGSSGGNTGAVALSSTTITTNTRWMPIGNGKNIPVYTPQGYLAGITTGDYTSSGGGGAGGVGGKGSGNSGYGGNGIQYSLNGIRKDFYWAGGGGGGVPINTFDIVAGAGGLGGGGGGCRGSFITGGNGGGDSFFPGGNGNGDQNNSGNFNTYSGGNGGINTGGGGGGGGGYDAAPTDVFCSGGNGGSGIVIIALEQ